MSLCTAVSKTQAKRIRVKVNSVSEIIVANIFVFSQKKPRSMDYYYQAAQIREKTRRLYNSSSVSPVADPGFSKGWGGRYQAP